MSREPIIRVNEGEPNEIGVYRTDYGWLEIVHYDCQGSGVLAIPEESASALGDALKEVSR